MIRNKFVGFAIAALLLGLAAYAIYSLFEIQPYTRTVPPSREARINEYLALDRWLEGQGVAFRIESSANIYLISQARERRIFLQSTLFRWTDYSAEYFVKWIEAGGTLFLVLDYSQMWIQDEPLSLLEKFGIKAEIESGRRVYDSEYPTYDSRVFFTLDDEAATVLTDRSGRIRFVQKTEGNGKLIVSGSPHFLLSRELDNDANARLALSLFSENEDWLFIRGASRVQGLLGSLFRQGNFTVLLVSVLVLIFIGFWAVIPGFGLVKGYEEKPGKALRERFLAEGTFLRKHNSLELYGEVYMKEIMRKLSHKEGLNEEEIQKRICEILGRPIEAPTTPLAARNFTNTINDYQTILERI